LLTPGVSFWKIYRVFPLASVRMLPRVALFVTITVAPPVGAAVEVAPVPGRAVAGIAVAASVAAIVGALVAVAASVGAVVAIAASVAAVVAVGWTAGVCEQAAKTRAKAMKILNTENRRNLISIFFSSYFVCFLYP
jgi:pheromone shutdown protein TraB